MAMTEVVEGERPGARSPLRLGAIALVMSVCVAGLTGLGVWQLERRIWKLDLIARVDVRVHATATHAPGRADWPHINANDDAYRHVAVSGHFLAGFQTLVQAVTERGPGYWVLVPFETDRQFTVLINRGFVTKEQAAEASFKPQPGQLELTGLLRMSEPGGAFLRANHPAEDRWYSRDVGAIAAADGLGATAPYFIDADASSTANAGPVGGLTIISFPNNHLVYALTWFGLAFMVAGWMGYLLREEWRRR